MQPQPLSTSLTPELQRWRGRWRGRWRQLAQAPLSLPLMLAASPPAGAALPQGLPPSRGQSHEPLVSIGRFSDLRPSDWAYQALRQLIERHGCIAGDTNGLFARQATLSRMEAAALLNACLLRVSERTDELQGLLEEFEAERALVRGRLDGLEAKMAALQASAFSPTTKLSGLATFVLGASRFGGSATDEVERSERRLGGTSLSYDLQLTFNTSFNGKDQLRANLRAGNFAESSFGGAGPSTLSQLEVAFQQDCGIEADCGDVVAIDRLFYQVPLGDITITVGPRVGQDDMLAIWPSVYPAETILDVLTLGGAPGAYNKNQGAGAGLWWQKNGWAISASYVAAQGDDATPDQGGLATTGSGSTGTVQIGYGAGPWTLAAIYSRVQNGNELIPYATTFTLDSYGAAGVTSAFGLSGSWQPSRTGWIPSISAGWGLNSSHYESDARPQGLVLTSQSWSVGLQWKDALVSGHVLGLALGQPTFATRLENGNTPQDGNLAWEGWYQVQLSDHLSITPALFLLSRPLGGDTPRGESFSQLGALIKTSFRF